MNPNVRIPSAPQKLTSLLLMVASLSRPPAVLAGLKLFAPPAVLTKSPVITCSNGHA